MFAVSSTACVYCLGEHASKDCSQIEDLDKRRGILGNITDVSSICGKGILKGNVEARRNSTSARKQATVCQYVKKKWYPPCI